jgi:ferredoxin
MPSFLIFRFVEGDYYKIADVKLLYFFTEMSSVTLFTLIALFGFSLIYRNFWCRYLCPYGALLGILSVLSPLKIRRDDEACTHCSRCSRNCPSGLPVDKKTIISSPECTGCLTCVGNCPSRGALDVGPRIGPRLHPLLFAALIAALLFGSAAVGMLTGRWHSSVTPQEYRQIIPQASALEHP